MKKKERSPRLQRKSQRRKQVTNRAIYTKAIRQAELKLNRRFQKQNIRFKVIAIKRKKSFKERISRQTRKKATPPLQQLPSERIRRSLTKQFRQDEKPYFSYIKIMTINSEITLRGLNIEMINAEAKLKRLFSNITASGDYLAPEYQKIPNSEDKQLDNVNVYVMGFITNDRGKLIQVLDYTA